MKNAKEAEKREYVLFVTAPDRSGILRDVANLTSRNRLNILTAHTHVVGDRAYVLVHVEGENEDFEPFLTPDKEQNKLVKFQQEFALDASMERIKDPQIDSEAGFKLVKFRFSSPDSVGLLHRLAEPLAAHKLSIREYWGRPHATLAYLQDITVLVATDSDLQGFKRELYRLEKELSLIPLGPEEFDLNFPVS